jgi:cell division protein FtsI/penicillin-binding protein 2
MRKVPFELSEKIRHAKIKGIGLIRDSKRYYPNQSLAAHLIGFAGMDNKGLEGLELMFDKYLRGEPGYSQILRDAKQRELLIEKSFLPPKDGFNLVLTIDETIQYISERALDKAFAKSNAIAATVIVVNPKTGEILALVNRPTYDLTNVDKFPTENRMNRAISLVYEPGSVFKIVAASAALEEGVFKETDKIFCENGSYSVGGHILHDHHGHGTLTFSEVMEQSSNIGVTKIAQKMGPATWYKYAKRFRFGDKTGIDLLGEVDGWVKKPSVWSKTSISALPIGQEVTVTPIQLVAAIAAIANDGVYMKPHIVKYVKDNNDELIESVKSQAVSQVISPETAKRLQAILKGVVERGTAKKAQIAGISVAGKTGTAQKVENGRYSKDSFFASFIGFAPVENAQLAVIVMFDDPHPDHFGGTVAAPVFRDIVVDSLKYMDSEIIKP